MQRKFSPQNRKHILKFFDFTCQKCVLFFLLREKISVRLNLSLLCKLDGEPYEIQVVVLMLEPKLSRPSEKFLVNFVRTTSRQRLPIDKQTNVALQNRPHFFLKGFLSLIALNNGTFLPKTQYYYRSKKTLLQLPDLTVQSNRTLSDQRKQP